MTRTITASCSARSLGLRAACLPWVAAMAFWRRSWLKPGLPHVVALDSDAGVLARAKARHPGVRVEWRHGDVLDSQALSDAPFDAVFSVATLHHMDAVAGLVRCRDLVRPGGVVGLVGLAANDWWDLPIAAVGRCVRRAVSARRDYWEHSAPMTWPPPATYREMKRLARAILPGVRYRRHLYGRYSLVWARADRTSLIA